MTFIGDFPEPTTPRGAVEAATRADESERVKALVQEAELSEVARAVSILHRAGVPAEALDMLAGATVELAVGDPALLETDVGPVIDAQALETLESHARRMERQGSLLSQAPLSDRCANGTFFAPRAFRIESMEFLQGEVFGPILHVIEYDAHHLDRVIEAVNATGFGLTVGVHSRVDATQRHILERLRVGNSYVNRNIIGAVVGVQPFGGEGLSGTGPKAGGPRYLHRFATERCVSVNTAATGGNATLMSLQEDDAPPPDGEEGPPGPGT